MTRTPEEWKRLTDLRARSSIKMSFVLSAIAFGLLLLTYAVGRNVTAGVLVFAGALVVGMWLRLRSDRRLAEEFHAHPEVPVEELLGMDRGGRT